MIDVELCTVIEAEDDGEATEAELAKHRSARAMAQSVALGRAYVALSVLTMDPKLLAHLEARDPMALRQARAAMKAIEDLDHPERTGG